MEPPQVNYVSFTPNTFVMVVHCSDQNNYEVEFTGSREYLPRTKVLCDGLEINGIERFLAWFGSPATPYSGIVLKSVEGGNANGEQGIVHKIELCRE